MLRYLKSVEDLAEDGQHAFPILSGSCVERGGGVLQLTTPAQICGASQGVVVSNMKCLVPDSGPGAGARPRGGRRVLGLPRVLRERRTGVKLGPGAATATEAVAAFG